MDLIETKEIKIQKLSIWEKAAFVLPAILIPLIGQIIGIIFSIVFMNYERDSDKRAFGVFLLITSLLFFIISAIIAMLIIILF